MKRIILTIFTAFLLSACGGGGGGAAPSVNSDDSRITATEVRAELNDLRKDLGDTPDERRLATKLSELESDIDNARRELKFLLDEIAKLRTEWNRIKTADISPPPPPNCGMNEKAEGQICKCVSGYVRDSNNVCMPEPPPPPNCDMNEKAEGQICKCISGYVRDSNNVCMPEPPPPPNCDMNEKAEGQICKCISGYVRDSNNVCMPEPPPPPNCDMNEKAEGQICNCVSGYIRQGGMCVDKTSLPCTDFRVRDSARECTYDTEEFRAAYHLGTINALYAYQKGYHGQGVTVIVNELGVLNTHYELTMNLLYNDLSYDAYKDVNGGRSIGHGTRVVGVLGAARDGKGMHGVAPSVRIYVPLNSDNKPVGLGAYQYAVSASVAIVSESVVGEVPFTSQESLFRNRQFQKNAARVRSFILGRDIVRVLGAGNSFMSTDPSFGTGVNSPHYDDHYMPIYDPDLEPNFIIAASTQRRARLASFSNACGPAKMYCITTPGIYIYTSNNFDKDKPLNRNYPGNDPRRNFPYTEGTSSGTSYSAPMVAGALALLKSAAPQLPMTVIRHILLQTATPLGSRITTGMPDEWFGWGEVNVSTGIVSIEALETQNNVLLRDLRNSLPGEFAHLRGRLSDVSVALRITDRNYYNIPLSDIVGGGDSDFHRNGNMGRAAEEMQADDYAAGESFRFWGGLDYDGGKSNYIGEGGGIFSAANTEDIGGYMRWTTANYGGISAFGEYGRTEINADYGGNPLIAAVDNARAEEWTMGIQYRDLWRKDDNIILSARQESRISGGNMILRYPVADGDSHKAFIGETPQTIRTETTRIPIKQKPQTIWTLGYSQKTDNGKWSAATEWNTAKNKSAFSFAIELQIR